MMVWQDKKVVAHSQLLSNSFFHWTKKRLVEDFSSAENLSEKLYQVPFVLVSHGIEKDPVFNYANLTAQKLWNFSWEEFTQLLSRLSAESVSFEERQELLNQAQQHGFIDHYTGIRISRDGKRFRIKNTILWNVVDAAGIYHGQAAMFRDWEYL